MSGAATKVNLVRVTQLIQEKHRFILNGEERVDLGLQLT